MFGGFGIYGSMGFRDLGVWGFQCSGSGLRGLRMLVWGRERFWNDPPQVSLPMPAPTYPENRLPLASL